MNSEKINNIDDKLVSSKLMRDPRIGQAKQLILSAVEEYKQTITGIRPPNPVLAERYHQLIKQFSDIRGGQLWYPYIGSGIGNGALVELLDGSVKYDFISGIGVHYWGHSHLDLVLSGIDASISNTIMQGNLQQNVDSLQLSELLIEHSHLDHCFLTTSGAMANENALKIAFQKHFPASRILAFEHCFAGRTLATSRITDKPQYRAGLPPILNVDYIPFYDPNLPDESTRRAVETLRKHIARYPKEHAAMIFELVQGEGGFYTGSHDFFIALMKELKDHGIAVIIDEVQTFGRTPELFAFQYYRLEEYVDIVSIGKLAQVCATLFKASYKPKAGLLSQTFTSSTAVINAGYTIIDGLIHEGYYGPTGKIQKMHDYMVGHLKKIAEKYPDKMAGPWGIGAMIAFTPLGGDREKVLKFSYDLFEAGVISFIAGSDPVRIRFLLPAGVVTEEDMHCVCEIIETTLSRS